jgi:molybdopterin-biosynthesis enzyme MoeA-like protein
VARWELLLENTDLWKNLKRIEVIADDESEIIEAVRRMSDNYDFVVTSGGIGPT